MYSSKKTSSDFVQDSTYAIHFATYKGLLSKLLNHDPGMFRLDMNAKIVDVGCGYGELIKILRTRGYKNLVGIEPDPTCRKACLRDNLDVRLGTVSRTRLPGSLFDVVIVNQVFHHVNNFNDAAKELNRILKPGGLLCFLEPSPTLLRRLMDSITFKTSLRKYLGFINTRHEVMSLEMATGNYPNFLNHQEEFNIAINHYFSKIWHRTSWFFQFGKYRKKN